MTASSYQIFALGVLAVDLIDDLGVSRTALGVLGSVNTLVGALSAPAIGRFTDRIGASRSTVMVLVVSAVGMGLLAVGGSWWSLGLAAVVSGIPQGWGNPATNALIASRVPVGQRGTITGLKQSGVQFGIFLSGLTLPTLAALLGWRGAMWVYAVVFALLALFVRFTLGSDDELDLTSSSGTDETSRPEQRSSSSAIGTRDHRPPMSIQHQTDSVLGVPEPATDSPSVKRFIWLLALYGFLLGAGGGAIGRFLPLWAHEEIGMSTTAAGLLVALGGLLGIGARVIAGRVTERVASAPRLLSILAVLGASYSLVLVFTPPLPVWLLWPASVLAAIGIGAWNAVAMLAVIMFVTKSSAGRASGIVMLGFLGGLSVGAPLAGWVIDQYDSYQPVWIGAAVASLLGAVVLSGSFRFEAPNSENVEPAAPR